MKNKILLGLGALVFAGASYAAATGAFFTATANATGNVFTAGSLNLAIAQTDSNGNPTNGWNPSQNASWNFSSMAPGGTPSVSSVWLKNIGSIDGSHIGISATSTGTASFDKQVRITSLTLGGSNLLQGGAGATIGAYVAPTNCTVTLSGSDRLQPAVTNAVPGAVICATGSNYNQAWEGVSVITATSSNITIESMNGPAATASLPFHVTGSNVTIRGFSISNPSGTYGVQITDGASNVAVKDNVLTNIGTSVLDGGVQAIDLEPGSVGTLGGYTFTGNTISNVGNSTLVYPGTAGRGGSSAKAIYIGDSTGTGTLSNVTIENNIISNVSASSASWPAGGRIGYGILVGYGKNLSATGSVTGLVVQNNSISNLSGHWETAIGLEGNTPNASVSLNDIHDLGSSSAGVTLQDNNFGNPLINQNNFAPGVVVGIANGMSTAVNGQDNWWGDSTPANHVSGNVNTTGFLGGAVVGLINGIDPNGNGYADLQDLSLSPLVNAPISLAAGAQKKLVMGVQLDGPTTGNNFQGATLTTNLTFTLSQQ